jgi:CspA family cold shock protein
MLTGEIKHWNADRGFGFMRRDDGEGDAFVHIRAFEAAGLPEPERGDRFEFDIVEGRGAKPEAQQLRRVFD